MRLPKRPMTGAQILDAVTYLRWLSIPISFPGWRLAAFKIAIAEARRLVNSGNHETAHLALGVAYGIAVAAGMVTEAETDRYLCPARQPWDDQRCPFFVSEPNGCHWIALARTTGGTLVRSLPMGNGWQLLEAGPDRDPDGWMVGASHGLVINGPMTDTIAAKARDLGVEILPPSLTIYEENEENDE